MTDAAKAGIAAGVLLAVGSALILQHLQSMGVSVDSDGGRVALHWQPDGGDTPDGPVMCVAAVGFVTPEAIGAYGLADGGAGRGRYLEARICALDDGGNVVLPDGLVMEDFAAQPVDFDGGPRVVADVRGAKVLRCACSSGADCFVGGAPAPTGNTLAAGTWDGGGCVRKVCTELAGSDSFPAACPQ